MSATVTTADNRMTTIAPTPPSTPRLRMQPGNDGRTLLDGGWWPRSRDPVAELPGLVLAIDTLHGPVTRLILAASGWNNQPRRLGINGRVVRLGYYSSQPANLLTALCDNGQRVDLLVVPADTDVDTADTAMILAATTTNLVHAQHIMRTVSTATTRAGDDRAEAVWDTDGGQVGHPNDQPRAHHTPAAVRPT
jgi:Family of unknown function (DUF5994)